jgi:hypothetical protein
METTSRARRRATTFRRIGWLAVAAMTTLALVGPAAGPVAAATVPPILHEGNVTDCPPGYLSTGQITPPGTSGSADGVTVTVTYNAAKNGLDFVVSGGVVNIAYVKGGNAYNEYNYPTGVTGDTGLLSPDNASEGPAGISHSVFCVTKTTTTTTTDSTTTTDTTTGTTTATTTATTTQATTTQATTTQATTTQATTTQATTTQATTTQATTTQATTTQATTQATTTQATTTQATTTQATTTEGDQGGVLGATATPNATPPPTDTLPTSGTPGGDSWRLALLAIAGLLATLLLLAPATPAKARRRR